MRLPLLWLHDYVDPGLSADELATRLAMTGTEVDRVHRHGVAALEFFRIGKVLSAERHPDADRLTVCTVDLGEGEPHQIVCGAPNVAAGQTVAVASPGAIMPDGTKLKKAKLRGQESRGMILAEDEVAIGTEHNGIMVLPEDLPAGSPLADALPIATDVLELEITPNRPDCLSVYGVAREVHAITDAPLAPPPWSEDPGSAGRRGRRRGRRRGPGPVPALHRAAVRGRDDRPVAGVAEGAPVGRGPAPDQQRRRHHQLRDAADGPAAARVRLRPRRGRQADRPPRDRGRDDDDARRHRAHARPERAADRRRGRPDLDRGPDGRRPLRGPRDHHAGADGGRQLARPEPAAHLDEARAAHRGLRPLREGPRARAGDGRPDRRDQADARADRRATGRRHDRRRRRGPAAGDDPAARREGRAAARHRGPARGVRPHPARARVRRRGRRGRARRRGPRLPPQRRHARGRPRRGGRAPVGAREAPRHAALAPRRQRPPVARPEGAPPRRGRARRRRALRGRRLELRRPRPAGPAAARRGGPARAPGAAAQPDVRGAVDAAHDAARLAAGRRAPQPLARDGRRAAVRGRRDLPRHAARGGAARHAVAARGAHPARRAADGRAAAAVVARRAAAARGLLRRQGRAGGRALARSAPSGRSSPRASRSCTRAAPRAC